MRQSSKVQNILVSKHEGNRPPGKSRQRMEDDIKMNLKKVAENVDWMNLSQGHHENGNRLLVSIKGGEFLDQLSDISFSRSQYHSVGHLYSIFNKIQDNHDINLTYAQKCKHKNSQEEEDEEKVVVVIMPPTTTTTIRGNDIGSGACGCGRGCDDDDDDDHHHHHHCHCCQVEVSII